MKIDLTWAQFKTAVGTAKSRVRWTDRDTFYSISFFDDRDCEFITSIMKDSGSDQTDFETNFQSSANIPSLGLNVITVPDPVPFSQPTYRTKRDAIDDLVSVEPGATGDIDYKLLSDLYVSGGDIVIENAELGDYLVAYVEDADSLIPSPYRSALCEAWPVVAKYIVKNFVMVTNPGTIQAGGITTHSIDTYPLNAKITSGLYLCIEYHAVSTGLTRRIAVNYHLTKKL